MQGQFAARGVQRSFVTLRCLSDPVSNCAVAAIYSECSVVNKPVFIALAKFVALGVAED